MKLNYFGIIALALPFFITSCSGSSEDDENTDDTEDLVLTATESSTCDCESAWFNGTSILAPNEGSSSAFADTSTTNCLFHQWSWQKFLYITQVPSGESQPFFLSKMEQVTSSMDPILSLIHI